MVNKRVAQFNVDLKKAIYYYLKLTKPMHKLTGKKIELITEILYLFAIERKNFKRESDTWKIVFDSDNMYKIRTELDMGKQIFANYLTQLRNAGIIVNNTIDPKYNPSIIEGTRDYELVFKFNIKNGE
jgi:hypothetical protein